MKATVKEYIIYSGLTKTCVSVINDYLKKKSNINYKGDLVDTLFGQTHQPVDLDENLLKEIQDTNKLELESKIRASLYYLYKVEDYKNCDLSLLSNDLRHDLIKRWINESSNYMGWDLDSNGLIDIVLNRLEALTYVTVSELSNKETFESLPFDYALELISNILNLGIKKLKRESEAISINTSVMASLKGVKNSEPKLYNPWITQDKKNRVSPIGCSILHTMAIENLMPSWVGQFIDLEIIKENRCTLKRNPNRVWMNKRCLLVNPVDNKASLVVVNPLQKSIDVKEYQKIYSSDNELLGKIRLDISGFEDFLLLENVDFELKSLTQ
jgi:hypothetical protein